jgi:hypothetical protein
MKSITIHQDYLAPVSGSHAAQAKAVYRLMGLTAEGYKPFQIYSTAFRQEAEQLAELVANRPGNKGKTVIEKTYY